MTMYPPPPTHMDMDIKEQSLVTMPPLAKPGFPVRYSGSRACANTKHTHTHTHTHTHSGQRINTWAKPCHLAAEGDQLTSYKEDVRSTRRWQKSGGPCTACRGTCSTL